MSDSRQRRRRGGDPGSALNEALAISRRRFLHDTTLVAAGSAIAAEMGASANADTSFSSRWQACHDRVWPGSAYWSNPLQDWRVAGGRLECANAALDRNVHLLTRQLADRSGDLRMSVKLGRVGGGALSKGRGSAGFRLGINGPLHEYRNSLVFGTGLEAGVTADGGLFIGEVESARPGTISPDAESIELRLAAMPQAGGYAITLAAHDGVSGQLLGQVSRDGIPASPMAGNLALVTNFGRPRPAGQPGPAKAKGKGKAPALTGTGAGQFWFADWRVAGSKVEARDDRAFGPILFNHYTLSDAVMKMTAQMPPLGAHDSQTVRLQIRKGQTWVTIGEARIHPEARTATFRIAKWNDRVNAPYRLVYTQKLSDGKAEEHYWTGTVRRDPKEAKVLTVADVSCNTHAAFPNALYVANMQKLNPDLLAFVGDQFYESTGGYGVQRAPLDAAILDYLRKWFLHGWTWRDLTRDRPSVSLPDDHDVYQGNLWGEGGAARRTTQEAGGYDMPAEWVNVVYRTQASHHPDPYDRAPGQRGTINYYGPMTYGRVSFAIVADRQYKSGPEGKVPPTGGRGDHVVDMTFDPKSADRPALELLGEKQMQFLRQWAFDWLGADMKAVISQTIFTAMATTHGAPREVLRADYDANGWPQTPRNDALRILRKAFAFHFAGDQHLPAVVHYGIDEQRDACVAFAGPAVNVGYPRWWEPEKTKRARRAGAVEVTGDFTDHFGHPLTVLAVKNGPAQPQSRSVLALMEEKTSGIGLVRFDKARRKIIIEAWPYLADPTQLGTQFPGWPVTVDQLENYSRKPAAQLPTLILKGLVNPVVQVIDESDGEVLYMLRIAGKQFQPHVFAPGKYTVKISEPETGRLRELKGLEAVSDNRAIVEVKV